MSMKSLLSLMVAAMMSIQMMMISKTAAAAAAATTFDPDVMCTLTVTGTKIKDPRACNTWIECIDGKPIAGRCADDGDFYDRERMMCVPQANTTCISSNPCAVTNENGVFVDDPYSCSGYFYCNNGIASYGQCQSGLNYDPSSQNCILHFPCQAKLDPDSLCNIVPDGVFVKNSANCNGYQMCWMGEVINSTCPGTFYYDAKTGICDYPQNVDCVTPTIATTSPNAPNPDVVCTKPGLFVSDGETCNGYYLCQLNSTGGMELVHAQCPVGRFFSSSDGGACVARTQAVCSHDRCSGLGKSTIQLSNLSNDDCRGFAICQNGMSIGNGTCPNDEYFDEITQRCTVDAIKYPACVATIATATTATAATATSTTTKSR